MVSEKIKQFAVKLSFFVVSLLLVAVGVLLMRQKDSQEKLDEFSAAQENKNMMTAKTQTQAQISNSNNAAVPAAAAGTKVS